MRTTLSREYKCGYFVTEQEFRKMVQTCSSHLAKVCPTIPGNRFAARLRDGSVIETDSIDDVTSLENSGSKLIQSLELTFKDTVESPGHLIQIRYSNAALDAHSWVSLVYKIEGPDRDWVFLAAAEIEDRLRKTKAVGWSYWAARQWIMMLTMTLGLFITMIFMVKADPGRSAVRLLEQEYNAGRIRDPIHAMIVLERARAESATFRLPLMISVSILLGPAVVFGGFAFLVYVYPSYIFYWGDNIVYVDRRRKLVWVFWTVIVLGAVASLFAGILLKWAWP